ncbi:unnamed protein product [Spodoptera littoralis]|uniref:Uncharacterized protein n=1 Tax=Spodoptera littoralis TaxID=7109 RepID=A0A9P0HXQ0_SPOLI|nr:unnamed protein product [Spodoptera littoralis]CAH1636434.1 unnamed protein product [Spodoptera littoralis]
MASWARQCKPTGRSTMAVGLLLCIAWYYTILAGFFILYCPVMYLMFFSHKLYRKLVDHYFLYGNCILWRCFNVVVILNCITLVIL